MKKVVLTLTASLACLAAFAQGKISFQTDTLHLVYFQDVAGHSNGEAIYLGNMPGTATLVADLYMGTSSGSLFLYSSTTFTATPGKWASTSVQATANSVTGAPAVAGGTTVFVVTQIRDAASAAPNQWSPGLAPFGTYYGVSSEFQFTLGSAATYPTMFAPANGNWAPGTVDMSGYGAGAWKGAIGVSPVPEPTSMALLGLGTAAMLIFRRRK